MRELRTKGFMAACKAFCLKAFGDQEKGERMFAAVKAARNVLDEKRNDLKYCPCCDQPIADVKTDYSDATSVLTLWRIAAWCRGKTRHEFSASDVKHLLDHTQYANLNHLDRFGGIIYRPIDPKTKKPYRSRYYGINLQRADEFFRNERPAPTQIVTNRLTGERLASTEKLMRDFPGMGEYLDAEGNYQPDHVVSDFGAILRKDGLPTVVQHSLA